MVGVFKNLKQLIKINCMDQYVMELKVNILIVDLMDLIEILREKEDEKEKWEWLIEFVEEKIKAEMNA